VIERPACFAGPEGEGLAEAAELGYKVKAVKRKIKSF